ncbi:uncharacterized protein MEPE_00303 [Melanopsichium pennsylvanicum]|uniref:Uncharacterized protein n=2 Tax=Melanopsichium pennsylvanicum TaxID=63383 RepID=A0AAJ5C2J1_9BASI|nr:hypothetical protein BN887_01478 [Melanopsichium pennsylvanicum 4]SNX81598.1 uncharacterized protein MEPE_00303 [Melanopsichium pennsylvanicum]
MPTLPAAKVVGHDFLGNHIGELLIRQPVKRAAPPPRNAASSNGSTVCGTESVTARRLSVAYQDEPSMTCSPSDSASAQSATTALDSFFSVGAIIPLGISADPTISLENTSETSASEPSSIDSRSDSADADLRLHLDQLSLSRKRLPSTNAPTSPRVSFVTSFGAKSRRSGSRHAPSEAGSSNYFGISSNGSSQMSSASLSPMEPSGSISWNIPFREQNQSFAQAVERYTTLARDPSQQSQTSDVASSLPSKPPTPRFSLEEDVSTPTTNSGQFTPSVKSQSFSGAASAQPARQRLTRAATESTLEPIAQMQQSYHALKAPAASSGLSHSKSMDASTSGVRTHRKKPSLVQKGDDGRTFYFVDASSASDLDEAPVQEPKVVPMLKSVTPTRSASNSSSFYKDVVDVQYNAHPSASSVHSGASASGLHNDAAKSATSSATSAAATSQTQRCQQSTSQALQSVVPDHDTPHGTLTPLKPVSVRVQTGSQRPARKLRIQPNVQSRPSLLERTMKEQRESSRQARATSATGLAAETASSPAVTPSASKKIPESPGATVVHGERYNPVAYGSGHRTFRIDSPVGGHESYDFPFTAMPFEDRNKATERASNPPASHARTSDWARAQSLLASSPPAHDVSRSSSQVGYVGMQGSCRSLSGFDSLAVPAPSALSRHHTASRSSESTESPSLLDTRELLSPPETAISTPECESPPEHSLDNIALKLARQSSPLAS